MTPATAADAATRPGYLRDGALLTVEDLHCSFKTPSGRVSAVRGVSFDVLPGETLGLVGESGCGKTTTGRAILRLPAAQSGTVTFRGDDMSTYSRRQMLAARRRLQMIFQDPLSSFNPRRKVVDIVGEGLDIQGVRRAERRERISTALHQVGMSVELVGDRRAHEFSGGQCQRISIARALALGPELIVCDEPVASLDVSVQARVLNVLQDIRENNDLSLVFVSHDLAVVKVMSDRIAVMHRGRIVEIGDADAVYANPSHPYTRRLLDAVPVIAESERRVTLPAVSDDDEWRTVDRELVEVASGHFAAIGEVVSENVKASS
ncbi:ATP-binding cassette domain-containing protein [Luethyella okanaganae]|uniref:ATP-binding cassette domain-containing protein n=1 Tax=Luethyella okanaganae TaxID=69372 RepID=A0ABW1VIF9_9MICO